MFNKSSVALEQNNLRQVESTLDRLMTRKVEIENSIDVTRQKIAVIESQLSETMRGEESLTSLEAASRKAVSEKAQQEAWLANQNTVLAALDAEIAKAKFTIPAIEEAILRANLAECVEAERVATDALWKAMRGKLVEFVRAQQRAIDAANRMCPIDNRLPRPMPGL